MCRGASCLDAQSSGLEVTESMACVGMGQKVRVRTSGQEAEGLLGVIARVDSPGQRLHLSRLHAPRQVLVRIPHLKPKIPCTGSVQDSTHA